MRFIPLILVTLIAGIIAFALTKWVRHACCPDESAWLRQEFALSDAQLAAIKKIRADYAATCALHCEKIAAAKDKLASLKKSNGPDSTAANAARAELASISHECAEATRQHLAAIAAHMHPEQGRRYLELVGPKITATSTPTPHADK
jgi:hypothetical protein